MKCTSCWWPLKYKGGENKNDFGCSNPKYCGSSEVQYYSHMSVRENWWFAAAYSLPFKHGNQWYYVSGPRTHCKFPQFNNPKYNTPDNTTTLKTEFGSIELISRGANNWTGNKQIEILSIPYFALPVNDDFSQEFNKLINHRDIDRYLNKLSLLK